MEILPVAHTGQTATPKECRSWLREKKPLKSQLMTKTSQQFLWAGQSWQREQGEKTKATELAKLPPQHGQSPPVQHLLLPTNHAPAEGRPSQAGGSSCRSPAGRGHWETLCYLLKNPRKIHLEITYFEAVSGPGLLITNKLHTRDGSEGLLIHGLYLARLGVPPSILNQQAVHKSPNSFTTCSESPAEMSLPFFEDNV